MEYAESRAYQAGDEIRHMDWRVTARTARPHTKQFHEERERPVMLLLPFSQSLFFGTRVRFKSVQTARVAAVLAWKSCALGHRVGALCSRAGQHQECKPTAGERGVLDVLRALARMGRHGFPGEPDHDRLGPDARPGDAAREATDDDAGLLTRTLEQAGRLIRPASEVVLLCDWLQLDDTHQTLLGRLRERADLLLVQVADPIERQPPPAGRYPITDGLHGCILDTEDEAVNEAYKALLETRLERTRGLCARLGIRHVLIMTDDDPLLGLHGAVADARP
ncbi:MAG: DUF58 domain-containing protein [Gammaproteobacteria bacterium]|nr:DUF58 domain-containing protein [Gammaproteobacteria bacterium]